MESEGDSSDLEAGSEANRRMIHLQQNAEWTGEYRTVCLSRPPEYSYYGQLNISWGDMDVYECHHKLGRGKYSEVYQGCNSLNN